MEQLLKLFYTEGYEKGSSLFNDPLSFEKFFTYLDQKLIVAAIDSYLKSIGQERVTSEDLRHLEAVEKHFLRFQRLI